jgi:hypothetical protein
MKPCRERSCKPLERRARLPWESKPWTKGGGSEEGVGGHAIQAWCPGLRGRSPRRMSWCQRWKARFLRGTGGSTTRVGSRHKFTNAMDGQFPTLERLDIVSSIPIGPRLILPQIFDAPNLRHIYLRRVTLSLQYPLLTAVGLVFLRLEDDLISAYFSPSYLLTQLSFMPQLEILRIGSYYSPPPNLDIVYYKIFILSSLRELDAITTSIVIDNTA